MSLTWLHVSDFHVRGGDDYDSDVVLRALVAAVEHQRDAGRAPDLVFATGDVAYSGKAAEYEAATRFFETLLVRLRLNAIASWWCPATTTSTVGWGRVRPDAGVARGS